MKTLKLGMLVTALMLITAGFFAGCKANIATPVSEASFAANADEYQAAPADHFKVVPASTAVEKYGDKDEYRVKIVFTQAVKEDDIKNGVKFYKLANAAKAWEMPAMTEIESKDLKVADKTAYFTISAKDIHLYVYVKASETKAVNGMKLNQDGDEIWGEEGDDDYAYYSALGAAPALTGNVDHNKKVGGLNDTLSLNGLFGGGMLNTKKGTNAESEFIKKLEIDAANFITILENAALGAANISDPEKEAKAEEAKDILNKHLKLKQFNWKENKWDDVPLNFSYDKAAKKWVTDITVEKQHKLALRWENRKDIEMKMKGYGYTLRANTLKNNDSYPILSDYFADDDSGYLSTVEGDIFPLLNKLTVTKGVGKVEITLSAAGVNFPFYIGNNWFFVTEDNKDNTKKSLFKGFKPETVVEDNFKCTYTNADGKVLIPIRKVTLVQTDVDNYPWAFDKIVIEFENASTKAKDVYISPEVRMAAFEGSYPDGGLKGKTIPELCFANNNYSGNPYEWNGWLKK